MKLTTLHSHAAIAEDAWGELGKTALVWLRRAVVDIPANHRHRYNKEIDDLVAKAKGVGGILTAESSWWDEFGRTMGVDAAITERIRQEVEKRGQGWVKYATATAGGKQVATEGIRELLGRALDRLHADRTDKPGAGLLVRNLNALLATLAFDVLFKAVDNGTIKLGRSSKPAATKPASHADQTGQAGQQNPAGAKRAAIHGVRFRKAYMAGGGGGIVLAYTPEGGEQEIGPIIKAEQNGGAMVFRTKSGVYVTELTPKLVAAIRAALAEKKAYLANPSG